MSDPNGPPTAVEYESVAEPELFSLLGKAHTMAILHEVLIEADGPVRFGELQAALDVSPNTLSRRLGELDDLGLLDRTQYDEIPPRVEYEPTAPLADLEPTFRELDRWMRQYGDGGTDWTA
ncbi:winged helix-turn-helix transcriptional regulator [Halolamina litorea]|uniref:Winged helix-turn-helix transcriptional regulator n=1 Tax=Halolamina litorea TaxID=1515593 RepID=A0ABD6BR43_9EURY|nr:winged helix-turn-helix transcriptional regulator [Halolamina litorea]